MKGGTKMSKRLALFVPIFFLVMSGITYPASGNLDTTFNPPNGVAVYDSGNLDEGWAVAVQSDGKIVVAGYTDNGADDDVLVLRYNANGSLDTSFGTNGVVTYDSGNDDYGTGVAIQSDGKIVVAGERQMGMWMTFGVLVLRYNANGTLDTSFGTNGVVTYDSGNDDYGRALAIQSDGKIVVAGYSDNGANDDVLVLRYNANGTLDTGFGTNGVVLYNSGNDDYGTAVAVQSDGKIVVAGERQLGVWMTFGVLVLRYTTNGSLDTGFGTNGMVTYNSGNDDYGRTVAIQSDGKIVVAGSTDNGANDDVLVLRYNSGGSLDTAFGTNGVVTYDSGNDDYGRATAIQSNGKIIVAGETDPGLWTPINLLVLRHNANGSLDTGFGTNGVVTYDSGDDDYGRATTIQSDGKIVVAGERDTGADFDAFVARFTASGTSVPGSGGGGSGGCFISSTASGFRK